MALFCYKTCAIFHEDGDSMLSELLPNPQLGQQLGFGDLTYLMASLHPPYFTRGRKG